MPNLNYPIPDLEATVERQVAISVAKQLCKIMEIKDVPNVVFNGQHQDRPTSGSADQDNITRNELNGYANVFITYEEEDTEDAINVNAGFYRPNEMYLFNDEDIGVKVFANYIHTIGRIQFRYQGVDRNMAHQFNNKMRTKYFMLQQEYLIEPEYNYYIPNEVFYALLVMYKMKKGVIGEGVSDSKYLSQHFIKPIYVKKRSDGVVDALYKREIQSGVFGDLSPDTKVLPEKEGENSKVTLTYTFEFKYHKPSNIRLVLPIMVGQKTIPKQFRLFNQPYDPDRKPLHLRPSSYENLIYRSIPNINRNDEWQEHEMLRSPNWDEFNNPDVKDYMVPIMSMLLQIPATDKRTVCTLESLKHRFKIHDKVYRYMSAVGKDLLSVNKSAVILSVFYNDVRMSPDIFEWDDERDAIVAKEDLDLLKVYHVVVSLNIKLTNNSFDINKFLEHGESSKIILTILFPGMKNDHNGDDDDDIINRDGTLKKDALEKILEKYYKPGDQLYRYSNSDISVLCQSYKDTTK